MDLGWTWSYPGQSRVESGGDALKTGRVTGTLVQVSKLFPYFQHLLKLNLNLFLGVIHFQQLLEEKPPSYVQF